MNLEVRWNLGGATSFYSEGEFVICSIVVTRESIRHLVPFPLEPLAVEFQTSFEEESCLHPCGFDPDQRLDWVLPQFTEIWLF